MRWPQVTMLCLYAASLAIALVKHGEPREPYNFWIHLTSAGLGVWLLYEGEFFK